MNIIDETVSKIKSLEIQGATNVAKASLSALKEWSQQTKSWTISDFKKNAKSLATARPTEPFVQNILSSIVQTIELNGKETVTKTIEDMEDKLTEIKENIIASGLEVLKGKNIILTHCHSTSVEEILKKLHSQNQNLQVFATETRPLFQGRTTVEHLSKARVKVTMITDSQASFMVSQEDDQKIDAVLIGADAILPDGSIINKVGSYGISLSAKEAKVPLYIVASLLKFTLKEIKIEEREASELWQNPPEGVLIFNPAFDKVPEGHIKGIITEAGIVTPDSLSVKVSQLYPWVFKGV